MKQRYNDDNNKEEEKTSEHDFIKWNSLEGSESSILIYLEPEVCRQSTLSADYLETSQEPISLLRSSPWRVVPDI